MTPFKSSAGRNFGKLVEGYKTSTLGLGLAAPGSGSSSGSGGVNYRDYGNILTGLTPTGAGVQAGVANIDQNITSTASWSGMTDGQTVTQFSRYVTWYKNTSFNFGGMAITSGHGNSADSLGAKDVAIYTSTDTTNGIDGNWTIQTPKWIRKSYSPKHGSSTNYDANRTSSVDSNHWIVGSNYYQAGSGNTGGANGLIYNANGGAPQHDRIYFDGVSNIKGVRLDIRGKWHNGSYSNEKPHITTAFLFESNNYEHASTELENDSATTCYIDPGLTSDSTNFTDQSGNGYSFATNNSNNRGTITYNSADGGHIQISGGSLRNGGFVGRGGSNSFSMGCWIKINGGASNASGGAIWYGSTTTSQHVFVRNSISTAGCMAIGSDISGNDTWVDQYTKDQRLDAYVSTVGVSNWFFFCLRYHSDGLVETSWDGRPFDLQHHVNVGRGSSLTLPFGVGGDPYNDNDSSHYFGPFFFYAGIIPYGRVVREWERYKTRFGRSGGDPDYTAAFSGNSYNN